MCKSLTLEAQIADLWQVVSVLNLLSHVNYTDARAGEFQDSLELIAKTLTNITSNLQEIGDKNA